jgi:hypothetical protein
MATVGRPRISFIKMLEGFRGLEQVNIKPDATTVALATSADTRPFPTSAPSAALAT